MKRTAITRYFKLLYEYIQLNSQEKSERNIYNVSFTFLLTSEIFLKDFNTDSQATAYEYLNQTSA